MARLLSTAFSSLSTSQTGFVALSLFVCAFALTLCASHSRRWRRWSSCYTSRGRDPVIQQFHHDGMIFSPTEAGETQQVSGPFWQKNILMGGRCQLPDFSGVIIYDSAGNAATPNRPSQLALPWK